MKDSSMVAITVLLLLLLAPPSQDPTKSIVLLQSINDICTGVVVRPTQVLSAAHCVAVDSPVMVDNVPAKVIKRSPTLILIDVPELMKPGISIGAMPKRGDPVSSWGHAYNLGLSLMKRHVANFVGEDIMLDGTIASGMSGGPTLDAAGKLVGINQATDKMSYSSSIVCGADEIRAFLK